MPSITGEMGLVEFIADMIAKSQEQQNYAPVETAIPVPVAREVQDQATVEEKDLQDKPVTVELSPKEAQLVELLRKASPTAGRAETKPTQTPPSLKTATTTETSQAEYSPRTVSSAQVAEPGLESSAPELALLGIPALMRALIGGAVAAPASAAGLPRVAPLSGEYLGRLLLGGPSTAVQSQVAPTISPVFRQLLGPNPTPALQNLGELLARQTMPTVRRGVSTVRPDIEGQVIRNRLPRIALP